MKIKKSTMKITAIVLAVLIVGAVAYMYFTRPSYPEIDTPKVTIGNKDAHVKIIEFSDLQCPACKAAHPVVARILAEYGNNISFQYYHFPLTTLHPYAFKAAEASECANDQGKFREFVDAIYANPNEPTRTVLNNAAQSIGLDMNSFRNCLDSGAKKWVVDADISVGNAKGIYATPTIFINDVQLDDWRYDSFKQAIDDAAAKANAAG